MVKLPSRISLSVALGLIFVLALSFYSLICLITDQTLLGGLFKEEEIRSVAATMEGIHDRALLESGLYRFRVVYPYDFPELGEQEGINIKRNDFSVFTAHVYAGYDVSQLSPPEKTAAGLVWKLGEAHITDIIIENTPREYEGFPDMSATPGELGRISEEMEPYIEQMARDRGILEEAEDNSRKFLTKLFEGAGYGRIQFLD
ncbi:MAG: DUF4230 domain-containing protein [Spirochaetales bacterium]|nr:DUF4230 domain-containing protein [Spirochaetales bacterium]